MPLKDKEKRKEYQRKWREEHKEYIKECNKKYRDNNIKGRRENKVSFNKSIEYLEKLKDNKNLNVNTINKMQDKIRSLDEAFLLDIEKMVEKAHRSIKKVWYLVIKTKEEEAKKIEESYNKWLEQVRIEFPKAKITIGLYGDKNIMVRNELGRFEVIKEEKE